MELCEANAGQDRHMLGNRRTGKVCVARRQMVAPELKLTKKVTAAEDSTSCLRTLKLADTLEAAQNAQRLHRMEKRQSHITMNAERENQNDL